MIQNNLKYANNYISKIYFKGTLTKKQQQKLDNIKKNLTVNARETNAFKRTKTSAPDHRPTAKAMGAVLGAGLLAVLFCAIVIPDIPKLYRDFKYGSGMAEKKFKWRLT